MNIWYVYILKGENNVLYKGITNNLNRRMRQHELGQCNSTKRMGSFSLIQVEICYSRTEARNIEVFLKSGYGRELIEEIASRLLPEC